MQIFATYQTIVESLSHKAGITKVKFENNKLNNRSRESKEKFKFKINLTQVTLFVNYSYSSYYDLISSPQHHSDVTSSSHSETQQHNDFTLEL